MAKTAGGGGGALKTVLVVVLLTLIAAGCGGFLGLQMATGVQSAPPAANKPRPEVAAPAPPYSGDLAVRELQPMTANLVTPDTAWIRLQGSIVYAKKDLPEPEQMAAEVTNDIVAYLRTLTAAQLQGASGLQHLREDINDRVQTRSEGKVREFVIETLVVQ